MFVHSSTSAPMSGCSLTSRRATRTCSSRAASTSSSSSSPSSTRVNSFSVSIPTTAIGISLPIPAPRRCSGPSVPAFTVMTPTRRPAGRSRCTSGTKRRLEVKTGTRTAAASSCWYFTRKPQLVDRADALALESACALDEGGQEPLGAAPDDEVGVGSAHPVIAYWERERRGVAHVAGDAREARVEHEDADREAVLILAAPDAPGGHRPTLPYQRRG